MTDADLFMDLLEEGNLLLQTLNASLQVQSGQSGTVNILETTKQNILSVKDNKEKTALITKMNSVNKEGSDLNTLFYCKL